MSTINNIIPGNKKHVIIVIKCKLDWAYLSAELEAADFVDAVKHHL